MKKIFILTLISLIWITLTWCSQNKLSEDELFEKKQECANYTAEIWYDIEKSYGKEGETFKMINLNWIYYSQKINSCLYEVVSLSHSENYWSEKITLRDFFTKEEIVWYGNDSTEKANINNVAYDNYERTKKDLLWNIYQ